MDGDRFWKMPECYIRGSIIKYLRIPDEVVDKVKDYMQTSKTRNRSQFNDGGRGGFNRNKGKGQRGNANSSRGRGDQGKGGGFRGK